MNSTTNTIGGKAKSLVFLKEKGYKVPDFVVFTEDEIDSLNQDKLNEKLLDLTKDGYFAVRSSANLEDGKMHSFAGIFDTELYVEGEDILASIFRVFEQKSSATVKSYLKINQIDFQDLSLAVVVQKMIPAHISGVAFGADPNQSYKKSKIVSAVYGLGEGLVSGKLNADTFIFSNNKWSSNISDKSQKLIYDGSQLKYQDLEENQKVSTTLTQEQLEEIATLLNELENLYGSPQDIEFCYVNKDLFILQSRPITTLKKYSKHIVWDNSNIIESYPGITLPFTFSFILAIYEAVYKNFTELLGVPKNQIDSNKEVFEEMLGHINGRVYYHLINWNKALAMLPAYKINAAYMEKMMGVSEPLGVSFELAGKPSKLGSYFNLTKTLLKILILNRRLPKIKEAFTKKVNKTIADYKSKNYKNTSPADIWKDYEKFKDVLVNEWSPPLANDLLAMIYFGTLQKLSSKWLNDNQLHTQLVTGKHAVKSVLPAKLIYKIIETAIEENRLKFIQVNKEEEVLEFCKKGEFGETGKLILKYIELYGDRSIGELKLENETYTQNPESFISILKSYQNLDLKRNPSEPIDLENILKNLSYFKRKIFSYFTKKASETVADRENLRFDRTMAFGTVRGFLWEIGNQLEEENTLDHFHDIFYLKEEELAQYFEGKRGKEDLKETIQNRKIEFQDYKKLPIPPERIHQYDDEFDIDYHVEAYEGQLKGIPCCTGEVIGKVRVLNNPQDIKSLNGDILVTSSTDPGWISIFQSASAILVERGSTLSHAAIVSREMGIPCIVGIKGLTQILKSGDLVKMNGKTGIVELYEK